jgi:hypothetical protein
VITVVREILTAETDGCGFVFVLDWQEEKGNGNSALSHKLTDKFMTENFIAFLKTEISQILPI